MEKRAQLIRALGPARLISVFGLLCLSALAAGPAGAVTFDLTVATSTYQVQSGDTYADLLLQHQSETQLSNDTITLVDGISSSFYAGTTTDYSMVITTVLDITVTGTYQFQVGTDWGRGARQS